MHPQSRRVLAHVTLLVLAGTLVFANALQNGFHLDDFYRVVDNPGIRGTVPWWRHFVDPSTMSTLPRIEQYRPLLPLSLALNHALTGDSLVGYHVGNLLCHLAASVLVYFVVGELLQRVEVRSAKDRLALVVALLVAVHPVSGILVNYVCARDQLLMQAFLMGSLLAYLRLRRLGATPWRWSASLVLLALAMLAKTDAVVAPVLIAVHERLAGSREAGWRVAARRALPHAAVVAAFFVFTTCVLGFSDLRQVSPGPSLDYALVQAGLHVLRYLPHFVWPFPIRQMPLVDPAPQLWAAGLGLAVIAATVVVAWRARRRSPLLAFSIVAYWTLLAPTSSVLAFHHLAVDYRPYPGSPFLFLALALVAERWVPPRALGVVAAVAVVWSGVASVLMNRTWRTEETLWTHSVAYGGDGLAHHNLAQSIADRRDPRVRRHLEEALRLNPNFALAHTNLGLDLIALGEPERGLAECRQAVALQPDWAQLHHWLSVALSLTGHRPEALQSSTAATRLEPRNLRYRCKAAQDAQQLGDHALCLEHVAAALQVDPGDAQALFLGAFSRQATGDLDGAIADYERLLAVDGGHVQGLFNLGHALMSRGRHREAIARLEQVLVRRPDFRAAHLHLATCHDALGETAEAAVHRQAYDGGR